MTETTLGRETVVPLGALLPWITAAVGVAGALAAFWRVHVERERNKVLRDQLKQSERRPELALLDLHATGDGGNAVTFTAYVQNLGTRPTRATIRARVGDKDVTVYPAEIDLLVNAPRSPFEVAVPRPQLGDLMSEAGHATTLYDATLHVVAEADGQSIEACWREERFDADTDRARREIQDRYWRRHRGADTAVDRRAEAVREYEERRDSGA